MQTALQYARTRDDVSIAFSTMGRGSPVVFASNPCEVHQNSPHPHTRFMTDEMVRHGWKVIRYDLRGMGSSDRLVSEMTLDGLCLDVDAVVDRLGLPRFALVGISAGAAVAAAYAAAHQDRVSRLILLDPFPTGPAWSEYSPLRRLLELIAGLTQDDWSVFALATSNVVTNFASSEQARALAASLEASASPKTFLAYEYAMREVDLTGLLPTIEVPALVMHNTQFPIGSFEMSRQVASALPDARFGVVSGEAEAEIEAIDRFLRSAGEALPVEAGGTGHHLTPRESDVLRLVAGGMTNREISEDLVLSERTVARHITNIYAKLNLRSKAEATAYALRHDLV
jgi:pimeloyl-ACP methyl ester carboxylesterase